MTEQENEARALSKLWEHFWTFRQSDLEEADEWGFCSKKQFAAFMIDVINRITADLEEGSKDEEE